MKLYTKSQIGLAWVCVIGGKVLNGAKAEETVEVMWACLLFYILLWFNHRLDRKVNPS